MRSIKALAILFGVLALMLSLLAAVGLYDLQTTGTAKRETVILLTCLAAGSWMLVVLLLVGGSSSRAAGRRSEIRIYENGFVLIQGKRFGGEQTDTCLWTEIKGASPKIFKMPSPERIHGGGVPTFVGYSVVKTDGATIFLSANFDDIQQKLPALITGLAVGGEGCVPDSETGHAGRA